MNTHYPTKTFNTGDILRVVESNPAGYNITSRNALVQVVDVMSGSIKVKVIKRIDGKSVGSEHFGVTTNYFNRATQEDFALFGLTPPKGESKMKLFNQVNEYVEKHKDILFTVALVLTLDHFVFEGKFRQKVEDLVDSFLKKHTSALPGA